MGLVPVLLLLCLQQAYTADIDAGKTIIWGPGLEPESITMRARYMFLQLVDTYGKNLTESPGQGIISVKIQGQTAQAHACHIWTQVLDCKDGSFIVRYKVQNTCFNLKIKINLNRNNAAILVMDFKGPIYEEECYCPNKYIGNWLQQLECPVTYSQMNEDLVRFPTVDFDQTRISLIKNYDRPNSVSLCNYVVKSNRIFRKCYGKYVDFKIFMDAILLSLTRKVILPDIELFVNFGDWPLVPKKGKNYPIFSWCGSSDTQDIIMPTYDHTESSLEAMGRVMLDVLSVQGNTDIPWEQKIEKLFWRGRDSRRERLHLIDIARAHPELFNASITNFFFFKDKIEQYGPGESHISFFQFFKYKYQLNIDGTVASYRFPYLLAGDGLVFKQDSDYYEFFYKDLISDLHYIPVKRNLSDLVEKVLWAKEHDEESRRIAKTARQFARDNLLPHHVLCYHGVLFNEWSKRLRSPVRVLDGMEEVKQPKHSCTCYRDESNFKDEL